MMFECDHLHLRSANPEAAASAYAAWFDATIGGSDTRMRVDLGGLTLLIERVPPDTVAAPPPPVIGIEHIGLRVADFDQAVARLRSQGVRFLAEPYSPRPGVKIAFVEGPDSVRVEIVERAPM